MYLEQGRKNQENFTTVNMLFKVRECFIKYLQSIQDLERVFLTFIGVRPCKIAAGRYTLWVEVLSRSLGMS